MKDSSSQKPTPALSLKRRVFSLPTLLSFSVAAAFIVLLATRFDLDWGSSWENIRGMNPWLYVLGFVSYYLSFGFRGLRWRILAQNADYRPTQGGRLPTAIQAGQLIIIGWFVNSIAWLRLGDAYRAYAFAEDSKGGFSWSLGTILAERVLDMAVVFAVLVVGTLFLTASVDSDASIYILISAFIMAFGLVSLMVLMKVYGVRLARFLPQRFESGYHRFHQGTLGSFKQLPTLVFLSAIGWTLEITRLYFVVSALGLNISIALLLVVALGHAILSTVPTPGGIGVVEPGLIGLLLLSLDRADAVSVALVDRSITYVSIIVVGGLVFLLRQVTLARRQRHALVEDQVGRRENALGD